MEYQKSKTATILSGVLAIILGLILIAMPSIGLTTLVLFFSIYLILYGIVRVVGSIGAPQGSPYRLPWLVLGAIAILGGLGLIFYPGVSVVILAYYVAFYAIAIGILELMAGFRIKGSFWKEILIIIAGALSVLFGIYLIFQPHIGVTILILVLGWYLLFYGILLVIYGFTRKSTDQAGY